MKLENMDKSQIIDLFEKSLLRLQMGTLLVEGIGFLQ